MRRITGPKWPSSAHLFFLGMLGCGETAALRSAGEACSSDDSCEANLCYTNVCLEPAADDDLDGLTALEAQLKTDPQLADSDGDGLPDGFGQGSPESPKDEDGDEVIDAIESLIADEDEDYIPDQKDDERFLGRSARGRRQGLLLRWVLQRRRGERRPRALHPRRRRVYCSPARRTWKGQHDEDALDACDPCPEDITNTCDLAPHSVTISPAGPSREATPVLSGVALYGDKIVVSEEL